MKGSSARRAVVVGGGIGGVAAAVGLGQEGWEVLVLERAPQLGEVGAGVTLMANALRALDELGLGAAIRDAGHADAPGGARTSTGRWLSRIDSAQMTMALGTRALGIHRATLHRLLRSPLLPEFVATGAEVSAVEPGDARQPATVTYRRNGAVHETEADLVVAADGLRSKTRTALFPDAAPPTYQGSTAWRSVTREAWEGPLAVAISWGRGTEFGMVPLGDGRVYWFGAANAQAGERSPDEMAEVRRRFGSWHAPIPELLDATDPGAVLRNDIFELAKPLRTYVCGRVALLGDAAHAMTPNLGQGAGQALEDAAVLAVCMQAPDLEVEAALARYDALRRPRTQDIVRQSHLVGRFGQQLHNPLAVGLRNTIVRLTPPAVTLRAASRATDWQPPPAAAVAVARH